jgi:hypothetical protein
MGEKIWPSFFKLANMWGVSALSTVLSFALLIEPGNFGTPFYEENSR